MTELAKPRGTRDILPKDVAKRRAVEGVFRRIVRNWGFGEIVTPTFEDLELFRLKSGEGVLGEIYYFTDKGDRELALRPELTAPTMRAYVNEMQSFPKPVRLFYFENCFRYERPQKGRYREFWQFGTELIGSSRPESDAEIIALAMTMLKAVGIRGDLNIGNLSVIRFLLNQISSESEVQDRIMRLIDKQETEMLDQYLEEIGAPADLQEKLRAVISLAGKDAYGAVAQARLIAGDLPQLDDFEKMLDLLAAYGISGFTVNFGIARGLDYYTGTVFEIYAEGLGAQKQVCGGGSYKLISLFGGGDVVSTGFGLGFDRIMEICDPVPETVPTVYVVSKPATEAEGIRIASELRQYVPVITDVMQRSFSAQLNYANTIEVDYILIVGEKEAESGLYSLKDMKSGEQVSLTAQQLIDRFSARSRKNLIRIPRSGSVYPGIRSGSVRFLLLSVFSVFSCFPCFPVFLFSVFSCFPCLPVFRVFLFSVSSCLPVFPVFLFSLSSRFPCLPVFSVFPFSLFLLFFSV